jgi:hypothetical protein
MEWRAPPPVRVVEETGRARVAMGVGVGVG